MKNAMISYYEQLLTKPKILSIDGDMGLKNFMRTISTIKIKPIYWRDDRKYMFIESVYAKPLHDHVDNLIPINQFIDNYQNELTNNPNATCTIAVTGYLRGNSHLSTKHLIHLTGYNDYQISKIDICDVIQPKHKKKKNILLMIIILYILNVKH